MYMSSQVMEAEDLKLYSNFLMICDITHLLALFVLPTFQAKSRKLPAGRLGY